MWAKSMSSPRRAHNIWSFRRCAVTTTQKSMRQLSLFERDARADDPPLDLTVYDFFCGAVGFSESARQMVGILCVVSTYAAKSRSCASKTATSSGTV